MWRGVTVGKPFLGGATMVQAGHHNQKFVCYPISRAHAERGEALINWICDLHMGDGHAAARGLEPPGQACRLPAALRGLEVRLARRAGRHPGGARHLRIPHGRSRSAAALVARPRHAAGRCRASDVSHRLERRLAGDPRRRGDHPGASGRRRSGSGARSATSSAACRRRRASSRATAARASTSCSTSSSSARRRDFRTSRACCRPTSWRRSSADYKKLARPGSRDAAQPGGETIKNRPFSRTGRGSGLYRPSHRRPPPRETMPEDDDRIMAAAFATEGPDAHEPRPRRCHRRRFHAAEPARRLHPRHRAVGGAGLGRGGRRASSSPSSCRTSSAACSPRARSRPLSCRCSRASCTAHGREQALAFARQAHAGAAARAACPSRCC